MNWEIIDEGWLAKRKFSDKMTDPDTDELYETAKNNGVIGGKLLGARRRRLFPAAL